MRKFIIGLLAGALLLAFAGVGAAADAEYQGVKKCSMCHKTKNKSHVDKYMASKHFKAFESLKAADQQKADCVACHTTGFGKGGYEIKDAKFWSPADDDAAGKKAMAAMAELQKVGCESCHSDLTNPENFKNHKKDAAYKPVLPTADNCKVCHNEKSPAFKAINFVEEIAKMK